MKTSTKKNWGFRLMLFALLFTLVSTCLMSGTLAKYITSSSGTDTARVAKWGVVISSTGTDLFSASYAADDTSYASITNSVSASVDVVAPGTTGTASGFSITGTPEVACLVSVTVDTTESELTGWTLAGDVAYEPIVWSINGTVCGTNGTFSELLTALDAIEIACPAGTDLSTIATSAYVISWAWDFDDNGAGTNDANDTYLGNKATAPTITLVFSVTVTQID